MTKKRVELLSMEERATQLGLLDAGVKSGWIIQVYPDGREEIVQPNNYRVPIGVGAGWLPIVYNLLVGLAQSPELPEILGIENKMGELRVYLMSYSRAEEDQIAEAEAEAETVCEFCGQPGRLREDLAWMRVLCDQHYAAGSGQSDG
jgi:hypothetical protein